MSTYGRAFSSQPVTLFSTGFHVKTCFFSLLSTFCHALLIDVGSCRQFQQVSWLETYTIDAFTLLTYFLFSPSFYCIRKCMSFLCIYLPLSAQFFSLSYSQLLYLSFSWLLAKPTPTGWISLPFDAPHPGSVEDTSVHP